MTILEYQRERPWAHKRRTRRMAADIMPRNMEWPIVIVALITAVLAWITLVNWATAEEGQAGTERAAQGQEARAGAALPRMTVAVEPGSTLTIRAEPCREAKARGALTAGTEVLVLEQRDGWALVDWPIMGGSGRGLGWVFMDYLE